MASIIKSWQLSHECVQKIRKEKPDITDSEIADLSECPLKDTCKEYHECYGFMTFAVFDDHCICKQ